MPDSVKSARDRARTQSNLKAALAALLDEKSPVTISAVAARANVTPGLIHNTYPDMAETIRRASKRARPKSRDSADELLKLEAENKRLQEELAKANIDIKKLGSIQASLREEIKELRAREGSNVLALKADNVRRRR